MPSDPRQTLLKRLGELLGREEAITRHLRGEDGRRDADFADVANFTAGDEVLEGLEEAALLEIQQIRAALERVADGTYGICAKCGVEIPEPRLTALPATPFCVTCAP